MTDDIETLPVVHRTAYLAFVLTPRHARRRTDVWEVHGTHGVTSWEHATHAAYGTQLGTVRWFGAWRQYILEPAFGTVWNTACLQDVVRFIGAEMDKRAAIRVADRDFDEREQEIRDIVAGWPL